MRNGTRFNSVPVLEIDGAEVTQSNALSRYVGKMAGLYPADDLQALYCDEVLGALEDLSHYVVQTFGLQGEELRVAREKYFADKRLTIADLKVFVQTRSLRSGNLDYVPSDIAERLAPGLVAHQARIEAGV